MEPTQTSRACRPQVYPQAVDNCVDKVGAFAPTLSLRYC